MCVFKLHTNICVHVYIHTYTYNHTGLFDILLAAELIHHLVAFHSSPRYFMTSVNCLLLDMVWLIKYLT